MDIAHAKSIPMRKIFAVWGIKPNPILHGLDLYTSPFDCEQKTKLVVNPKTNTWYDPVSNTKGDTIKLVCLYLQSQDVNHTVMDALRWLKNMVGFNYPTIELPPGMPRYERKDGCFVVKDKSYLSEPVLIRYLEENRCIPFRVARHILQQVRVLNRETGRSFIAIGFENEDGGFAIRNPKIKAHLGNRAISFIRGRVPKPSGIHVFKDVYDYLSAIIIREGKSFTEDAIILNSYDCLKDMTGYIRNYGYEYLHSWLGNNEIGIQATNSLDQFCKTEQLKHHAQNTDYASFNDMNAKLIARLRN
ncbi:MAG: hypothetical protein R2800_09425 [Flavipsychrobacter sp.]